MCIRDRVSTQSTWDLLQFEPENLWGSFGKMTLAKRKTEPRYGFGTSTRDQQELKYESKEMAKITLTGKTGPGPNYDVTDKYSYIKAPEYKFGTNPKNTLDTGPKFDHYLRQDIDFNPHLADEVRRKKNLTIRIGLESRFPNEPKRSKGTPGPHYNPSLPHEIQNAPKYTLGFRRALQGQSPLQPYVSTPSIVGPGLYMKQQIPSVSTLEKQPAFSVPKAQRSNVENRTFDKYQSYDYKQKALGVQVNSKKKTLPAISIGRSLRDNPSGIFKQHMTCSTTKVRISHPNF
eukprot:TRINITY_DN1398_c0_g1_i2.p1 TRINITY_DN1398_c0_g1~~TRINITY_DN1398_c0_g1_i2.p1  ORF type:complete len:332 (-),score=26.75 TRINITY_DN1398_c0_g1_i2:79-945(-)